MSFEFVTGRPSLDFVATVAERGTSNVEQLATPHDLTAWIHAAGIVDDLPRLADADLTRVKALREHMFALVRALIDGATAPPSARNAVNAAARRPGPTATLRGDGRVVRRGDLDAVLAHLAADLIALHAHSDAQRLRWCADSACTRPFIDRSRGGRRRWCGMKGCGDRAKAAAYRERRRDHPDR